MVAVLKGWCFGYYLLLTRTGLSVVYISSNSILISGWFTWCRLIMLDLSWLQFLLHGCILSPYHYFNVIHYDFYSLYISIQDKTQFHKAVTLELINHFNCYYYLFAISWIYVVVRHNIYTLLRENVTMLKHKGCYQI